MRNIIYVFSICAAMIYEAITASRNIFLYILLGLTLSITVSRLFSEDERLANTFRIMKLIHTGACISLGTYFVSLHFSDSVQIGTYIYLAFICFCLLIDTLLTKPFQEHTANT